MASSSQKFVPANYQAPLPHDQLIIKGSPSGEDVVPLDVVFVGGGPAGLCGAIELARLVKKDQDAGGGLGPVEIGVLEKGASLGAHTLSGAVMNPMALRTLFPELKDSDFPFRRSVKDEKVMFLSEKSALRIPTPPTMQNHGNYVASLCEVVRWLGTKAEELGINILTGFPADSLYVEDNRVVGIRTVPAGLDRQGQSTSNFMPPTDISAKVVALSEGTRGPLTQAYMQWQNLTASQPQIYALGVKEVWKVKQAPKEILHTLGWPLPRSAFGGSWLYPMADDLISIGLVVGLDYRESHLDVHHLLQTLKTHPAIAPILVGGECLEWGAKTIPEGGIHSIPHRLHGDGLVIIGDSAGLVNVPALKGIHYAMMSGIYAARSIFAALKKGDTTAASLKSYDEELRGSFIFKDLYAVRNMRLAFKDGVFMGGIKAGLMTLTKGMFPGDIQAHVEDAEEWKEVTRMDNPLPKVGLSKVDAVYKSGNKTRDDIPQHLIVGQDVPPEIADFYSHMCPAGVYERSGDRLIVNAPNCVDCKATDVLGPRWRPREGGSGPNYQLM